MVLLPVVGSKRENDPARTTGIKNAFFFHSDHKKKVEQGIVPYLITILFLIMPRDS